jgi:hypothetical protein
MTKDRLDRINDFEEFYKTAYVTFNEFLNSDNRVKDFKEIYGLNISPKNETDEYDKRTVAISWGFRKYDRIIDIENNTKKALVENGATLYYERLDSGHVVILLYPAHTENRMPIEDSITLKRRIDPKELKDKRFLKNNWNDLIAYMESTSLDGNPSFLQKMKISYLRTFKHLIIDKKARPTRFSNYLKYTFKFVGSVGLSGFIIYIITLFSQKENNTLIRQQIDISKRLVNCVSKLDSIVDSQSLSKTLPILSDTLDVDKKKNLNKVDKKTNEKKHSR